MIQHTPDHNQSINNIDYTEELSSDDAISIREEWNALLYNQHSSIQYLQAMKLIDQFPFQGNEHICDIGSGDGKVTQNMAKKVPTGKVYGIEKNKEMLQFSSKQHSKVSNLHFLERNATHLNFVEEFDLVTSFSCLHWVENKEAAFDCIYQSLKKDGHALLTMPLGSNTFYCAIKSTMLDPQWSHYFTEYVDPFLTAFDTKYTEYAETAGFQILSSKLEKREDQFESYDDIFHWIKAIIPHYHQIPTQQDQDAFMHQLLARFLDTTHKTQDNYHFKHVFIELLLKKISI